MTRALGPRPGGIPPGQGSGFAFMGLMFAAVAAGLVVWVGGNVASVYSGHGWTGPVPSFTAGVQLVQDGPERFWPSVPPNLVWAFSGGIGFVLLLVGVTIYVKITAGRPIPGDPLGSLAREAHLAHMTPKGSALRAVELRPSLQGRKQIAPRDRGVPLGKLRPSGVEIRASFEEVAVAIMAPRAGKTTGLGVPIVLDAPGAVVATSNKSDLACLTAELRGRDTGEPVWIFDPQGIAHSRQTFFWNPLRGVDRVEPAQRLASQFIIGIRGEKKDGADFWLAAAEDVLTSLFLAAGSTRGDLTLQDVYRWLNRPTDPLPVKLLQQQGHRSRAESLAGAQSGAVETREGIFQTARTAARCLGDPQIMAWVTPPKDRKSLTEFRTEGFAGTRQTLYLLAKENAGGAGPLVAGFCDRIMQDAIRLAEGNAGRLDPPLVACLDEMCNLPLSDLPALYSHLGSRSIVAIGIAQSWSQIVGVWGENAAWALWGASTVKLLGAGIDEPKFLEGVSQLVGDHDVSMRSLSYSYKNSGESIQLRKQRIFPPELIRELHKGGALLFTSGAKVAMLDLVPWYKGPRREEIADANRRAMAALKARAEQQEFHEGVRL
jgi:type IV secretory pathway TraG/TraD family ATPase VirD4